MNIDELHDQWSEDCNINIEQIGDEVRRVPLLHSKYYRYYTQEHKALRKLRTDYDKLIKYRIDYYKGEMAEEDLKELGWEPWRYSGVKNINMDQHLNADNLIIKMKLMIGEQEEKVKFLEDIIKTLNNRGFLLKTAMDFKKFTIGQ